MRRGCDLEQDSSCYYNVVAFVDKSNQKIGKTINGIPIYNPAKILNKEFITKNNIKVIIFAIPSLDKENRTKIINEIVDLGVNIKSVPHLSNWIRLPYCRVTDFRRLPDCDFHNTV